MSFGAIIATGDDNSLLSDALMECLIEVRVEQSLDEPTRFGLRVREDFFAGEPMAARALELTKDRVLTIAVESNGQKIGLVRGPITDSRLQYMLGGPGSWYEVRGCDRRIELCRQRRSKPGQDDQDYPDYPYPWQGRASDAARKIISAYGFDPDVQDTDRNYTDATQTLNQCRNNLAFVEAIARENGFFFWISLAFELQGFGPGGRSLRVTETAHFRTSPFRALGPGGVPPSISAVKLVPDRKPTIRAGVGGDCGNNVTSFQAHVDVERPDAAKITAVDDMSLGIQRTTASDPQSALSNNGKTLIDATEWQRRLCVTAAGNAEEVRNLVQAALADTGWYITAQANTTAHMLGGILQPHDVVAVEAVGSRYSGPYRVKTVTHVITPADHFMDIELQTNGNLEK
jgi:hypothetical protein